MGRKLRQINHIQPGAFSNLHELRKLWLTSNKISSIGAGTLSIQTQVQMLVPGSNKFSHIQSAQNLQFVFHANGLYPVGHGLTHGNTRGQNQHSPEYEDVDNDHDQTGQGQSRNNTESHTNTTEALVTSGHDQTGQCQSHNNTESHTNTTDAVGATGHAQTIQDQYRPSIEILGAKKNPYYGTHETASGLNAEYSVSQSQASSDSNTNPKSTVVTGDQTGQSQYKVQAGVEVLDVRNPYYSRGKTASKLNPEYGVMGQS
ncbi:hypothetical protein Bbelb_159800 [Branchiostoma belcheri]|nr:hypothetical protein Bbelb_159800 [Branchiostoma belcheri]